MEPRTFLATEADWRSAASGAYYAAFHVARRLLLNCGFHVPRADRGHAHMWLWVSIAGDSKIEKAGSDLQDLRRDPNQADYELHTPYLRADALNCVLKRHGT